MDYLESLFAKIVSWQHSSSRNLLISGVEQNEWPFFFINFAKKIWAQNTNIAPLVLVYQDSDTADEWFAITSKQFPEHVLWYPGLDMSPYSSSQTSENSFLKRLYTLAKITEYPNRPWIIITSVDALHLKVPPVDFFLNNNFTIRKEDIISPHDLTKKLVGLGYIPATSVEEPGTFVLKGGILDIFPISTNPVRLTYFDDLIETINPIDKNTQRSIKNQIIESLTIMPAPRIFAQDSFRVILRNNLPMPQTAHKKKYHLRQNIFATLNEQNLFENYPIFAPLFFKTPATILDFLRPISATLMLLDEIKSERNWVDLYESLLNEFFISQKDCEHPSILPSPDKLYSESWEKDISIFKKIKINHVNLFSSEENDFANNIPLKIEKATTYIARHINLSTSRYDQTKELFAFLRQEFESSGKIIFCAANDSSKNEINFLIESANFSSSTLKRVYFETLQIPAGFYYPLEKLLVLSEADIFTNKKVKTKKHSQNFSVDLFAEQLASLKHGDFVVHRTHGIGKYLGLESISLNDSKSDYLVIEYAGGDKIYVPVYKMNLVQKHADSIASLTVSDLRSSKFETAKARAKASAKELAFSLIELQAKRETSKAYAFSPPDHYFKDFELAFPFEETKDQQTAINNVIDDMQKEKPMDHLVCGDVGFGKTEVAMRAAYKAVLDQKQVAILVPTTILAMQHYNSFISRFKGFPVVIEYVSRFKTIKECKDIFQKVATGKIDILIGTHKILSDNIKFMDLGLVIVDEEQRFGVAHKEKFKLMKESVDFLSMSATPIPRTLQLAFLGIRDLSLIQTAPPNRQSIKSYVIKDDDYTIKTAIEKELARGGQVYFVHNRVQNIDEIAARINELVPAAKILIGHGQLPERELEKRMAQFYRGDFNVLIATTIIESGIDIPSANTMIINRADTFGLSQLHQLRGRIGRSDKKAYAYFIIPFDKNLSITAEARLKSLQLYSDIGSGFSIASSDLEIRGAGDILGSTQSGHIEAIGLELYMQLLEEAIHELKGKVISKKIDIEISVPFPAFIPASYISDQAIRLKTYKKLSNTSQLDHLNTQIQELEDIYGPPPKELKNLYLVLETRINLSPYGIDSLKVSGNNIYIKFSQQILEKNHSLRNKIIEIFMGRPKLYQFSPDYSVTYTAKKFIDKDDFLKFSKDIAAQLLPC